MLGKDFRRVPGIEVKEFIAEVTPQLLDTWQIGPIQDVEDFIRLI